LWKIGPQKSRFWFFKLLLLLLLSFEKKHPPDFYNRFQHVANIKGFIIYFFFCMCFIAKFG
jgi:hypothetical protein